MIGAGSFRHGWTIEITDGVITYVGSPVGYEAPEGARIIDATGKTVMPGVIDAYVRGTEYASPDFSGEAIRRAFLLDGVTTTCNTGHSLDSSDSFEVGAIVSGVPTGRVYNSGPKIVLRGPLPPHPSIASRVYEVESEQEISDAIAYLNEHGADFIKASLGPVLDPRNHQALTGTFSSSQASQIVIYAGAHGMRARFTVVDEQFVTRALSSQAAVIDFVPSFHSLDSLINPTNRSPYIFAYTYEIPSQAALVDAARSKIIQMAESGVVMVPMITVMDREFPWMRPASGNPSVPARSMYEEVVQFFADRGGRVALGSGFQAGDTPGMPMDEIRSLQRAGLTNLETVTAITYHSALACGADNEIGTLTVGKRGDVLILDSNVLDDITALERPTHVFLDGKQVFVQ